MATGKYDVEVGKTEGSPEIKHTSITDIIRAMKKFVFPPAFDFVNNEEAYNEVGPFAMYVMEFKQSFDQQDLADIWQGLMPKPAKTASKETSSVEHGFSRIEMFSDDTVFKYSSKLRWMVFKVKQRAKYDFYETTKQNLDDDRFDFKFKAGNTFGQLKRDTPYSFNWPYDFCTFVEMVKLEPAPRIAVSVTEKPMKEGQIKIDSGNKPATQGGG